MIVGIDLGTTNSLIGCFRNGKIEVIPNRLGKLLTPSIVAIDEYDNILVGETAKEFSMLYPFDSASLFKRSMGTAKEFVLKNKKYKAEELSGFVLRSLKEDAEEYLGEEVTEAIISVPAYFNDHQRKATKLAGAFAGLKVLRIINEPTAAAIAYGMGEEKQDETCLVFDLGGGTFDVSIIEYYNSIMEVHAIAGDNYIGGEDFTTVLAMDFLEKFAIPPEDLDYATMKRLVKAAEICKCSFINEKSCKLSANIEGKVFEREYSLSEYEKICEPLLEKLKKPLERSIRDAKINIKDIDRVVLVGGATRLPIIRKYVSKLLGRLINPIVEPDLAVVYGAVIQCGMKMRSEEIKDVVLTDVCPYTLGTEVNSHNGYFEESGHYLPIIERNTVIPVSKTQTVYTAYDNQNRVRVRVLQGESRMAKNNLCLGEVTVAVPMGPKGSEAVDITYTYDVNSLLEVEVNVVSTGMNRKILLLNEWNKTEEEAKERMEELQYLKFNPRKDEVNRMLLLRGERLYEESLSEDRELINTALMAFEAAMLKRDEEMIEYTRKELIKVLDKIEFMN